MGDHTETVDIDYDPNVTSYADLLNIFWNNHDPCVKQKRQYMSAIFYHDEEQKELALKTKEEQQSRRNKITTEIAPAKEFYVAEDYHQKYMIQHHPWLLESLDINPGDDLIQSFVAARLNGYIGGYGTVKDFNTEAAALGLNEKMIEYVVRNMSKKY